MAQNLPEWTVLQARDRVAGLTQLLDLKSLPEIVILEDGHQTAGVPRHLDLLILDRWRTENGGIVPETGWVVPFGPYRETPRGAERANIWLVESPEGSLEPNPVSQGDRKIPVLTFQRRLLWPQRIGEEPFTRCGVLAGLARPKSFETACANRLGQALLLVARFADHAAYKGAQVESLLKTGQQLGVTGWLTTEKDWVKLREVWPEKWPVAVVGMEVIWPDKAALPDLVEERFRQSLG
jgi:tetraacyldisaccharide-1-P 4'-kinase